MTPAQNGSNGWIKAANDWDDKDLDFICEKQYQNDIGNPINAFEVVMHTVVHFDHKTVAWSYLMKI